MRQSTAEAERSVLRAGAAAHPLPAAQNNGAIYQAGFEQNLYDDRKAFRVGDIITITLNEKTQASKKANSDIQKDSKTKMGLTSLFGSGTDHQQPDRRRRPQPQRRIRRLARRQGR